LSIDCTIHAGQAGGAATELHNGLAGAGVKWKMDCEIAHHSSSLAAADELTMARIAALSGTGSFAHDSTTESRP
jgi:hypothetical protein